MPRVSEADDDLSCPVVDEYGDTEDPDKTPEYPSRRRRRVASQQAFNEALWEKVEREAREAAESFAATARGELARDFLSAVQAEAGRSLALHQRVNTLEVLQSGEGTVAIVQRLTALETVEGKRAEASKGRRHKIIAAILGSAIAVSIALINYGAARERVQARLDALEHNQAELRTQLWAHIVGEHGP